MMVFAKRYTKLSRKRYTKTSRKRYTKIWLSVHKNSFSAVFIMETFCVPFRVPIFFFAYRFWVVFCVPLLALGFQSLDPLPSARLLPLGVLSRQFGESLVDARAENSADPKPARGLWQQTFYVVIEAVRIAFWIAVHGEVHRTNIFVYHYFCDCACPAYDIAIAPRRPPARWCSGRLAG